MHQVRLSGLLTVHAELEDPCPRAYLVVLERYRHRVAAERVERRGERRINGQVLRMLRVQHYATTSKSRERRAHRARVEAVAAVVGRGRAAGRVVERVPGRR